MHYFKQLLTLLLLICSTASVFAHKKHFVTIADSPNKIAPSNSVYIYADKEGKQTFSSVLSQPELFEATDRNYINYGIQTSAVWMHMNFLNVSGKTEDITINLNNSDINYITFYELKNGKLSNKKVTGERVNTNDPILFLQGYNYQLTIEPEANVELYIKVENSKDAIALPYSIQKTHFFLKEQHINTMKDIFMYGFLSFIVIISFITFLGLKDKQFLYFGIYIASTLILTATVNGYIYKFILTDFPVISDKLRIFSIYSAILFSGLYSSSYLGLKKCSKKEYKYFNIFLLSFFATSVFAASDGSALIFTFYLYLVYAIITLTGILLFSFKYRKIQPFQSTILIFSYILPFVSVLLMLLRNIGFFEHHSVLIGFDYTIATQSLILIYGLVKTSRHNEKLILQDLKSKNLEIEVNNDKLTSAVKQLQRLKIASSKTENGIAIFEENNNVEWHNNSYNDLTSEFGCDNTKCNAKDRIYKHIDKCRKEKANTSFNLVNNPKDKKRKIYRVSLTPIINDQHKIENIIAVFTDISEIVKAHQENKRLNELLMQSQKMETIGKLAGGIAHDFNNLLTPIIGYSEMMLDDVEDNEAHEDLSVIHNSALRAKQLVAQILSFSKYFKEVKKHVSIHDLIEEEISILKSALPANIEMQFIRNKHNFFIYADETQIHQVILNLCTNAKQAIGSENGTVKIITEPAVLPSENGEIEAVKIIVSDSGSGIPPKLINNIFTPFFTTKSKAKGTGLGLSIAKEIITKYNGQISVESEIGKGTSFSVTLPVSDQTTEAIVKNSTIKHSGSGKKIMLVDDTAEITAMLERMLKAKNYSVESYNSSPQALSNFRKNADEYFAVITDQTMPEMSGDKLAENMIQHKPDINIIIITGYSETLTEEKSLEIGVKKMLLKPIDSEALLSTLEAL